MAAPIFLVICLVCLYFLWSIKYSSGAAKPTTSVLQELNLFFRKDDTKETIVFFGTAILMLGLIASITGTLMLIFGA